MVGDNVFVAKGYRPVMRDQPFLFPPDMREWLLPDHPVWTVIAIVERLDTSAFHQHRRVGGVGRAGYDPDMLLTLLIWAWSQGVRSSRRIERACADVVPYRVICAGDGPDHVTIARFRADNHDACEQLFTQVLVLAAQLGLGRLETVALDGVKIASDASLSANRSAVGLAKAAQAEAARLAAAALAEHAGTDAAEDAQFGADNPGLVPAELADPVSRQTRIDEALTQLETPPSADADADTDADGQQPPPGPPPPSAPSSEVVETEAVAHDRWRRIAQAQGFLAAQIAARDGQRQAVLQRYLARIAAGDKMTGTIPAETTVALAQRQLDQAIATSQARHASWAARGPVGQRRAGRPPVPTEDNARVRQARAKLDKARAAQAARAATDGQTAADGHKANITDPQSRMQPVRGGGWVQGYNCQAVTAADGLIVATGVGTSPVDNTYYLDMIEKSVATAALITSHRPGHSASPPDSIGIVLADAGYCTRENLTAPGPDRLIATGRSRDLHAAASTDPAQGPAPEDTDPITAMDHRLRTPDGIATYAQRAHIAETPFGHAKHNLGFRRFSGRGLARARSEWSFHAAVHNIGKIIAHLADTPLPA